MSTLTVQSARDAVRSWIRDGQTSTYATNVTFGLVRQENVSDEIPAVATPTQTQFYVRFSSVPLGKNVTVYAIPGTIAAYRDGAAVADTIANGGVTADIDQNGNFTLRTAPVSQLLVSYGWQFFTDADIDQYVDEARSWLFNWSSLAQLPDAISPALVHYASGLALQALSRACRLPDVSAGEASEKLSQVSAGFEKDAADHFTKAEKARADYWTSADQPKQPAGAVQPLSYPPYQPTR